MARTVHLKTVDVQKLAEVLTFQLPSKSTSWLLSNRQIQKETMNNEEL